MKARNACRRLARNRASASVAALALVMALAWALHRGAVGAGYRGLRLFAMANGMEASSRGDEMLLSLPDGRKCVFKAGGTEASILGTRAYLLFPARRRLGIWGISRADAETMLAPIFRPDSLEPRPLRNIVVDAGHGGKDSGALAGRLAEKNLNLAVALLVRTMLEERGYNVTMTRSSDETLPLERRVAIAEEAGCDLFLCIHFNSSDSADAEGIESYTANPPGTPSFFGSMGVDSPSARCLRENALLGHVVQSRLIRDTGAVDRGARRVQHYVTRNLGCPAVLVELGFISNAGERARAESEAYQRLVSEALCAAIDEYAGLLRRNGADGP